jgi:hypothetical protein
MFEDEDLTHEVSEISPDIYDDGRPLITRQITPKSVAPVESQKGLSRRVLWTVVSIVVLGLAAAGVAIALSASHSA